MLLVVVWGVFPVDVRLWLVVTFEEDILARLWSTVAIVPVQTRFVFELLLEVAERIVKAAIAQQCALTCGSDSTPASPGTERALVPGEKLEDKSASMIHV